MARLPWVKYWYADWTGDMDVQQCSLEARGAWHETLCLFWHQGTFEHTGTAEEWARLWRVTPETAERAIKELINSNVCEITITVDGVTLLSRRLLKEHNKREQARLRQAKKRGHADVTREQCAPVTQSVTHDVTHRGQEAKKPRSQEAKKPKINQPAARKWDGYMPKILADTANRVGLPKSVIGKCLKGGYTAEVMLAWCYAIEGKPQGNPVAYLRGCLRKKQTPPDDAMKAAAAELRGPVENLNFGDALKTPEKQWRCASCGVHLPEGASACPDCGARKVKPA